MADQFFDANPNFGAADSSVMSGAASGGFRSDATDLNMGYSQIAPFGGGAGPSFGASTGDPILANHGFLGANISAQGAHMVDPNQRGFTTGGMSFDGICFDDNMMMGRMGGYANHHDNDGDADDG